MAKENLECARNRHHATARGKLSETSTVLSFYETYAPDWKRLTVPEMAKVVTALDGRALKNGRWASLPQPPSGMAEDAHFKRLQRVFNAVISAVEAEPTLQHRFSKASRQTKFMCRPKHTTNSEVDGASHKVDAIGKRIRTSYPRNVRQGSAKNERIRLRRKGQVVFTADALMTGEFKLLKLAMARLDNEKKTLGHAGHAFYNDVGRIAIFAFTIEDTTMRIWCHTRSHTGISKEFDIHTDHEELIQFILFTTYATPAQLGVDETVRRVVDKLGQLQYQFDIYDDEGVCTTYQTTRSIDESSAMELYSRAMRVFEVVRVLNPHSGKKPRLDSIPLVLRDYYVYSDVEDESKIQGGIKLALEAHGVWNEAERHFMRIKHDGVVRMPSAPDDPNTVPAPPAESGPYRLLDSSNPSEAGPSKPTVKTGRSNANKSAAATAVQSKRPRMFQLHPKKHARTVYEQLCIDLYKVPEPKLFFHALGQGIKILRYLKLAGYVHRDISPGNFLLHYLKAKGKLPDTNLSETACEDWVTILSDLEYARPFLGGSGHDPITGTSFYVATEVQSRKYAFPPSVQPVLDLNAAITPATSSDSEMPFQFAFNFYHDAESVLWMAFDFVTRRIPSKKRDMIMASGKRAIDELYDLSVDMFTSNIDGSRERTEFLKEPTRIEQLRKTLMEIYGPVCRVYNVAVLMNLMAKAYKDLEGTTSEGLLLKNGRRAFDPKLFIDTIYNQMEQVFTSLSEYYADEANADTFVSVYEILAQEWAAEGLTGPAPPTTEDTAAAVPVPIHTDMAHDEGDHTDEEDPDAYSDDSEAEEDDDPVVAAVRADREARDANAAADASGADADSSDADSSSAEEQNAVPHGQHPVPRKSKRKREDDPPEVEAPAPATTRGSRSRARGAQAAQPSGPRRSTRLASLTKNAQPAPPQQPAAPATRSKTTRSAPPKRSATRRTRSG
ncbi:hypothetical protein EV715DRAFT_196194 [Schizophyllum commune]